MQLHYCEIKLIIGFCTHFFMVTYINLLQNIYFKKKFSRVIRNDEGLQPIKDSNANGVVFPI